MNFEPVLQKIAECTDVRLPAGNPWKGCITATVADPKESPNTWACVHLQGEPRELVAGNATMQAECRLYAQIVPTEGPWSAAQMVDFADELTAALQEAAWSMRLPDATSADRWLVLGFHLTGGVTMSAEKAVGYTAEQTFLLTVQF